MKSHRPSRPWHPLPEGTDRRRSELRRRTYSVLHLRCRRGYAKAAIDCSGGNDVPRMSIVGGKSATAARDGSPLRNIHHPPASAASDPRQSNSESAKNKSLSAAAELSTMLHAAFAEMIKSAADAGWEAAGTHRAASSVGEVCEKIREEGLQPRRPFGFGDECGGGEGDRSRYSRGGQRRLRVRSDGDSEGDRAVP
mmetsp:Transcript_23961/g.44259  ORF Transcript_23961/g.44259 Transcript_23961/m.44259 type:complete len:196 (-) Transcript_23961:489-1076(-)